VPRSAGSLPFPASVANRARAAANPGEGSASAQRADGAIEIAAGNAEDRAYLQIIDLLRTGKASEAREAARDYLRRFPEGFRRVEVGEVAGSDAP
jgi:TolA-binding protein